MTTTLSLILVGILCLVFFIAYAFGEYVGYRSGAEDEARRHEPTDVVKTLTSGWGSEPEDYQLQQDGK